MPPSDLGRPVVFHFGAALVVIAAFLGYYLSADEYVAAMQEDGVVEWMSFLLFAAAGVTGIVRGVNGRRVFDLLVALFCLFVAGEEISWGQRLIGYVPPDLFLENNFQQETNLHNFSGIFGRPKWVLAAALAGYGLLLPAAARNGLFRRALNRIGATAPPLPLVPWFAGAVLLLIWYPIEYTGEWVEMLAGGLFVASLSGSQTLIVIAASLPAAIALAWLSHIGGLSSLERLACARDETAALARDVVTSAGYPEELLSGGSIEKRIWSAAGAGYLDWNQLAAFNSVICRGEDPSRTRARRKYGVDPWGNAYWIQAEEAERGSGAIVIYSFGPNRRRDLDQGDDIRAVMPWPAGARQGERSGY